MHISIKMNKDLERTVEIPEGVQVSVNGKEFTVKGAGKEFVRTMPTGGFRYEEINYRGISFKVYDMGGQKVFVHTMWKSQVSTADAIIPVCDTASLTSIRLSQEYLRFIASWMKKVPLMILGNK